MDKKKIIIISVVVAIVLIVAITLGVVFGTKNSPKEPVWGEWEITNPTATEKGSAKRTSDQGTTESIELPILTSSDYIIEVVDEATFDNEGKAKYTYTKDGNTFAFEVKLDALEGKVELYINGTKSDKSIAHKKADDVTLDDIKTEIDIECKTLEAYSDAKLTTKIDDINAFVDASKDTTIYLKMTVTYTINVNGGVLTDMEASIDSDKAITLTYPTKEGYYFKGWYTTEDFAENSLIDIDNTFYNNGNITIYAKWEEPGMILYKPVHEEYYDETTPIIGYEAYKNPDKKPTGDIVFESKFNGMDVVRIGYFANCKEITSIYIPSTVKKIGSFEGCSKLMKVTIDENNAFYESVENAIITKEDKVLIFASNATKTIPDYVTRIESEAFSENIIDKITIPKSVTFIASSAFYHCTNLTKVEFEEGSTLETIYDHAFQGCTNLTDIVLPESLKRIGQETFGRCTSLTTINIPKNVRVIGQDYNDSFCFIDCPNLETITVDEGNTNYKADNNCLIDVSSNKLMYAGKNVTSIPPYVKIIAKQAFYEHDGLTELVIPDSVEVIGESAFADCANLTTVTIPAHIRKIKSLAFAGCSKLAKVVFKGTVEEWNSVQNDGGFQLTEITEIICEGSGNQVVKIK